MFDPRGDDVIATVALCKVHTFEREIVSLAAAAGEDNVILLAPKESRNLSTCFLKRGFGRGRGPMPARRITEVIRKKRFHRGGDRGVNGCACVVIEVDAPHVQN